MNRKDIAAHFKMKSQTLSYLWKNADKIKTPHSTGDILKGSKRQRTSTHPDVKKALLIWFSQKSCRPELRLDGAMLLQQANKFLKDMCPDSDSTISIAWIDRFKKRHGIVRITKAGESGGVNTEIVNEWKEGKLKELAYYEPQNIFNADETGLFWLLLPSNSLNLWVNHNMVRKSQNLASPY